SASAWSCGPTGCCSVWPDGCGFPMRARWDGCSNQSVAVLGMRNGTSQSPFR
ncbi:MAG: hypothetical protein, partial [Olavius algarvensis Gamma 1 endosymbiont]